MPGPNVFFHDLPIYRLDQTAYDSRIDREVQKVMADVKRGGGLPEKVLRNSKERTQQHFYELFGPWKFNEIIGHLRLHFLGSQVRGEYFGVNKKRLTLTRRKTLIWHTWKLAPEREIPADATNDQILAIIHQYVNDCRKELPRRHFDESWLTDVGPYIDWRTLMNRKRQ